MTTETIARALDARKTGPNKWVARCPSHTDKTPSLAITERDRKILVHCFSGCSQSDVIDALRSRGLWPEKPRREWTPAERHQWAAERRRIEQQLPATQYWRRAAVQLTDGVLDMLKAALFDPTVPWPEPNEIYQAEQLLSRLRRIEDADLVNEYVWWGEHYPDMTAAMVRAARHMEQVDRRALLEFLRQTEKTYDQPAA